MRSFFCKVFLILIVSKGYCITVTQSNWSGGPGITGPVPQWTDTYCTSSQIYTGAGYLETNSLEPVGHQIGWGSEPAMVDAGDIDNDGDIDVVVADQFDILLFRNMDQGLAWTEEDLPLGYRVVKLIDYDDDGYLDIISGTGKFKCYTNTDGSGTQWNLEIMSTYQNGTTDCDAADLDGDGDKDLMGSSSGYYNFSWWEDSDDGSSLGILHDINSLNSPQSIQAVDMDGDGDYDALGASLQGDKIIWCENLNAAPGPHWPMHFVVTELNDPSDAFASDLDGDGDMDVVGSARSADVVGWWENVDGQGNTWDEHLLSSTFDGAWDVCVADMDNDGDMDVISVSYFDNEVAFWENRGTEEWMKHTVTTGFEKPTSICVSDINGDGFNDVICVSKVSDSIFWWSILEYSPSGFLESSILDSEGESSWISFCVDHTVQEGTSLFVQFRSSNDWQNMGEWSELLLPSDTTLCGIVQDSTRFFQYRFTFESINPLKSTLVHDISVTYESITGIERQSQSSVSAFRASPANNPSDSFLSIDVTIPVGDLVDISIFDLYGRTIHEEQFSQPAGSHSVVIQSIFSGYYICRVDYRGESICFPIVVLR